MRREIAIDRASLVLDADFEHNWFAWEFLRAGLFAILYRPAAWTKSVDHHALLMVYTLQDVLYQSQPRALKRAAALCPLEPVLSRDWAAVGTGDHRQAVLHLVTRVF